MILKEISHNLACWVVGQGQSCAYISNFTSGPGSDKNNDTILFLPWKVHALISVESKK